MKRSIATLLIAAIVGGTMHLDEMVKVTFLFSHYQEHKLAHPGDSISVFLYKHYILNQKAESKNDKKQDAQLPFKSAKAFIVHFIPFSFGDKSAEVMLEVGVNDFISYPLTEISTRTVDIWLPPKV